MLKQARSVTEMGHPADQIPVRQYLSYTDSAYECTISK